MAGSQVDGEATGGGEFSVVSSELPVDRFVRAGEVLPTSALHAYSLSSLGLWGHGRQRIRATVVVSRDALPRGLVVCGEATLDARLRLIGCGLYAGGSLRGREFVSLVSPSGLGGWPPGSLPDLAYGGLYRSAAVHVAGSVYAAGCEVHDGSANGYQDDDDRHTAGGPPAEIVSPPTAIAMTGLSAHSCEPGGALSGGRLELDRLPPFEEPKDAPSSPGTGIVISLDQRGVSLPAVIAGDRGLTAGANPVTIVVFGDCRLGTAPPLNEPCVFDGALVVTGRLTIDGASVVNGSVYAGSLDCRSNLTVDATRLAEADGKEYAPGSSNVALDSWSD